jgi:hypothetical protein
MQNTVKFFTLKSEKIQKSYIDKLTQIQKRKIAITT